MMTVEQQRHARIMWEWSCDLADIQAAFNASFAEIALALAPMQAIGSLRAMDAERQRTKARLYYSGMAA